MTCMIKSVCIHFPGSNPARSILPTPTPFRLENLFMFLLSKPSDNEIEQFIASQANLSFSYRQVGATKERQPPVGYPVNNYRNKLGAGKELFEKAVAALYSWQMYALGWTTIYPLQALAATGNVVVVQVEHLGFWSLNPCRIVYTIDENDENSRRCGFAVGTLPAHSEMGEEQFLIEWDKNSDAVWYELYAFAKPKNLLAKIGSPYVTYLQKQFAAESYGAMMKAVG